MTLPTNPTLFSLIELYVELYLPGVGGKPARHREGNCVKTSIYLIVAADTRYTVQLRIVSGPEWHEGGVHPTWIQ